MTTEVFFAKQAVVVLFLQSGRPPPEDHATMHMPEPEPGPDPQVTLLSWQRQVILEFDRSEVRRSAGY